MANSKVTKPYNPDLAIIPKDVPVYDKAVDGSRQWEEDLTLELAKRLIACSQFGGTRADVALACGVRPALFEYWLEEGMHEDADSIMHFLSRGVVQAKARVKLQMMSCVLENALGGDWAAAARYLEATDPNWSKQKGKTFQPEKELQKSELSPQEKMRLLGHLLKNPKGELAEVINNAGLKPLDKRTDEELEAELARRKG